VTKVRSERDRPHQSRQAWGRPAGSSAQRRRASTGSHSGAGREKAISLPL